MRTRLRKIPHSDVGGLEGVCESVGMDHEVEEIVRAVFGDVTSDGGIKRLHQVDAQIVSVSRVAVLLQYRVELCMVHDVAPMSSSDSGVSCSPTLLLTTITGAPLV